MHELKVKYTVSIRWWCLQKRFLEQPGERWIHTGNV